MGINSNDIWRYYQQGLNENGGCGTTMGYMIIIVAVFLLCSCGQIKYVTVPEYHTEYKTRTDSFVQRDSVYMHDSVYVQRTGDTLLIEKWRVKYVDRWRDKVVTDTFIKTDSLRIPYPVERPLSRWQQIKLDFAGYIFGILVLIIFVLVIKRFIRKILP